MTVTVRDRTKRIGASDAGAILGLSPYKKPYEVWLEKTNQVEPWEGNEATRAGQKLESLVLEEAELDLGDLAWDVFCPSPYGEPIAATLDAQVISTGDVVECKTSGMTGGPVVGYWGEEGTDHIPEQYLVQTQIQMYCSGAELAHVYAYLGKAIKSVYQVRYDRQLAESIAETLAKWWEKHIVGGIAPDSTGALPDLLKRVRRQPEKIIEVGQESTFQLRSVIDDMAQAKDRRKEIEEQIELMQGKLILALGDAEAAKLADGTSITYMLTNRKVYTVEPKSYRTLRIKERK